MRGRESRQQEVSREKKKEKEAGGRRDTWERKRQIGESVAAL